MTRGVETLHRGTADLRQRENSSRCSELRTTKLHASFIFGIFPLTTFRSAGMMETSESRALDTGGYCVYENAVEDGET